MSDRFRSKPVIIHAYQFGSGAPLPPWLAEKAQQGVVYFQGGNLPYASIRTERGGILRVHLHDWIIYHAGKLRRCEPTVFAESYEPVDPAVRI